MTTITVPPITVFTDEPLHIVHSQQLGYAGEADKAARAAVPLEREADEKFNEAAAKREEAARLVAEADAADVAAKTARHHAGELRSAETRHRRIAETLKTYTSLLAQASSLPDPNERGQAPPPPPSELDTPIHAAVTEQNGAARLAADLPGRLVASSDSRTRVTQAMPATPPLAERTP